MAKRIPRVTDPAKAPHNAVHFDVWRLHKQEGTNPEGKRYSTWKPKRLTAGVGPDGRVSDRWLVAELSPEAILKRWGSGRYRIRYLGASYELVGSVDWELQAQPERSGGPLEPDAAGAPADGSSASRLRGLAGALDGAGVVELMMLLNDARESSTRQAREDADRAIQRERSFIQQMFQQHGPAAAAQAPAAPAVDMAREMALLRREMALTIREETARMRAEILNELPEEPAAENLGDALNGAGVGLVEGVGAEMGPLVGEALGALRGWLKSKGQAATPENIAGVIEAVRAAAMAEAHANGAGEHGSES